MFKWISCKRPKICYLLLYLSILNFVLLFNNGSSLYIYTNEIYPFITIKQSALDESDRKLTLRER